MWGIKKAKADQTKKCETVHVGPWQVVARWENCLCEDGVRRTVYPAAQSPDTFWTYPAKVQVKGKWVTGYIARRSEWESFSWERSRDMGLPAGNTYYVKGPDEDVFCANGYGKNKDVIASKNWGFSEDLYVYNPRSTGSGYELFRGAQSNDRGKGK